MERGWVVLAGSIHGTAVSLWERAAGRAALPSHPVLNQQFRAMLVELYSSTVPSLQVRPLI